MKKFHFLFVLCLTLGLSPFFASAGNVTSNLTIGDSNRGTYTGVETNFTGSSTTPITITIDKQWDTFSSTGSTKLNFGPYTTVTGGTNTTSNVQNSYNSHTGTRYETYITFDGATFNPKVTETASTTNTFFYYSGNHIHYEIKSGGLTVNVPQNVINQFSGLISGEGALTKTGEGLLKLSVGNSYTGLTTLNGGTLQIGTEASDKRVSTSGYTGGFNVTNGTLFNNTTSTLKVTVSGGTDTLKGGKFTTYSNVTASSITLQDTTLVMNQKGIYFNAGKNYFNNATIDVQQTTGDSNWPSATLFLSSGNAKEYYIQSGGLTINVADGKQADLSGKLLTSGSGKDGTLTKTGPGILSHSNAQNTFTGSTIMNAGTLLIRSGAALPGGIVPNNGIIQNNTTTALTLKSSTNADAAQSIELAGKFALASDAVIAHQGSWTLGKGSVIYPANQAAPAAGKPETRTAIGTQTPAVVTMSGASSKLTAQTLTVKDGASFSQSNGTTQIGAYSKIVTPPATQGGTATEKGATIFMSLTGGSSVNVSGGTLNVGTTPTVKTEDGKTDLKVETYVALEGANSTLTVSGGEMNIKGWSTIKYTQARGNSMGIINDGKLNVTGGKLNLASSVTLFSTQKTTQGANIPGHLEVSGGTLNVGTDATAPSYTLAVAMGSTVTVKGNGTINVGANSSQTSKETHLSVMNPGTVLNVDGGTINVNGWSKTTYAEARNNSLVVNDGATMNMTDGTINLAGCLRVGENGGTSTLNLSGGTINVGTNSSSTNRSIFIGGGGVGKLNMTGGTVNAPSTFGVGHVTQGNATISDGNIIADGFRLYAANNASSLTISGGSIHVNSFGYLSNTDANQAGKGTLTIQGSGIEWANRAGTGNMNEFYVSPNGKVNFILDEGGFSTIKAGTVTLASGSSASVSCATLTTLSDLQTLLGDSGICVTQGTTSYKYSAKDVSTGYLKLQSDEGKKALYAVLNETAEKETTVTQAGIEFEAAKSGFVEIPYEMTDVRLAVDVADTKAFEKWFDESLPDEITVQYDEESKQFKLTGLDLTDGSGYAWDFNAYTAGAALSGIYSSAIASQVPEPAAWFLLLLGVFGLGLRFRKSASRH